MSEPRATTPALVPAIARAAALLDLLEQQAAPMSLAQIASALGAPKSSLHGLCTTLTALGYLRRHDDGSFFIGPRVMGLAHAFAARSSPAGEFARMAANAWFRPEETAILSILDGNEVLYVATRLGTQPLGLSFTVGTRWPAHRAATGRAMLAFLEEATLKRLYPAPRLPAFMTLPSLPRADLMQELALTRERGYSVDDEVARQGVYCVAAPVFDSTGQVVAGLVISQQKSALKPRDLLAQRDSAVRAARELSGRLGSRTSAAAA